MDKTALEAMLRENGATDADVTNVLGALNPEGDAGPTEQDILAAAALLQAAGPDRVRKAMGGDDEDEKDEEDDEEDGDDAEPDDDADDDDEDEEDEKPDEDKGDGKGKIDKAKARKALAEMGLTGKGKNPPGESQARKSLQDFIPEAIAETVFADEVFAAVVSAADQAIEAGFESMKKSLSGQHAEVRRMLKSMQKSLDAGERPRQLAAGAGTVMQKSAPSGAATGMTKAEVEGITTRALNAGLIAGPEATTIDMAFGSQQWPMYEKQVMALKEQMG